MCQNISKEVLLSSFKNQAKIHSEDRKGTFIQPPCIKKGLRNSNHSMSMVLDTKKSNFGNQQFLRFIFGSLWHVITKMRHLQHATICDKAYYKMQQLLQNAQILLQNATIITKYVGTDNQLFCMTILSNVMCITQKQL